MEAATRATEILEHEHRVIERMLDVLDEGASRLGRREDVPASVFLRAAMFFREFADKCHHAKEEDILYRRMEERGFSRNVGPIAVMLADHDVGRSYVRRIAAAAGKLEAGDRTQTAGIMDAARSFSILLREHILKEDRILYPMANDSFSDGDQKALAEAFEAAERKMGEGTHERYLGLVSEMEAELGVDAAPQAAPEPHGCCCG